MKFALHRTALALLLLVVSFAGASGVRAQGRIDARAPKFGSDSSCYQEYLEAKQTGTVSYGCYSLRSKLNKAAEADAFFGSRRAGGVPTLRFGSEQTQIYSELLSDNIYVSSGLGFARLGLATVVSTGTADSARTVDQFFQGGGNAILYVELPQLSWVNYAVDTNSAPLRTVNSYWTIAVAGDVPKIGGSNVQSSASFRVGHQFDGTWRSNKNRFGFFANVRGNYVKGTSSFNQNLVGAANTIPAWGMLALDYGVGVDLADLIRVGVGGGRSTAKGVRSDARLTVELVRQR